MTAFTVAHSITLIASAYNLAPDALWFPPLIETLIAASIVYMALENIVGGITRAAPLDDRLSASAWCTASASRSRCGRRCSSPGSHLLASLLSFNIGVELGQLLVLALLIPTLELLFRFVVAERMGTIILSAMVAHTAWHWMIDRGEVLRRYQFKWPEFNAAWWVTVLHTLMLIVVIAGLGWLTLSLIRQYSKPAVKAKTTPADDLQA